MKIKLVGKTKDKFFIILCFFIVALATISIIYNLIVILMYSKGIKISVPTCCDSMDEKFFILKKTNSCNIGDVCAYTILPETREVFGLNHTLNTHILHRVIDKKMFYNTTIYTFQGDNNEERDPFVYEWQIKYKVIFSI